MPPRRPARWIRRPHLLERLSSEVPVVVLCGPLGSGRSSLLAGWAADRDDVAWVEGDVLPELERGTLLIDEADHLPGALWEELGSRMRRCPELRLRLAAHMVATYPLDWQVEVLDDLYFTPAEVADYLATAGSPAEPYLVTVLTEGHPAAVRDVAVAGVTTASEIQAVMARSGAAHRFADDDLILALPDHLTPAVADLLGGRQELLAEIESAGLARWTGDPGHRVLSVVPPVREANRAARPPDPRGDRVLREQIAEQLLTDHAYFPAMIEAVRADRLDLADRAVTLGGMPILRSHGPALRVLLEPLPRRRLGRHPILAMVLALILNVRREHRIRALEMLGIAAAGARLKHRGSAERLLLSVVESVGLRVSGTTDGGVSAARRAAQMLEEIAPDQRAVLGSLEADLHVHVGLSLYGGGHEEEAREQFELALGTRPRDRMELLATGSLAMVAAFAGEMELARGHVAEIASRRWPPEMLAEYAGSALQMAQAQLAIERFDFAAAARHLDLMWPIIDTIEHWPLLGHLRALVDLGIGEAPEGLERFRSLRAQRSSRWNITDRTRRQLDRTESLLLLGVGDLDAAARMAHPARRGPADCLHQARVALIAGQDGLVLQLLREAHSVRPVDRVAQQAMEVVLLHRVARREEIDAALRRLRALIEVHACRSPLMLLPDGELSALGELADGVPQALAPAVALPELTPREQVVLEQLVRTGRAEQIARELHVSVNTVKSQRRTLYRKLGVSTRNEALAVAHTYGLLGD